MAKDHTNTKRKFVNKKREARNARKAKNFKGNCFNYNKLGHMTKECRASKKAKKTKANMIKNQFVRVDIAYLNLTDVVFESNLIDNPKEW